MKYMNWQDVRKKHLSILKEWKALKEKNSHLDLFIKKARPSSESRCLTLQDLKQWSKYKTNERMLLDQIPKLYRKYYIDNKVKKSK